MLLMSLLSVPLIAILSILFIPEKKVLLGLERERFFAIAISLINIFISFLVYTVNLFSTNQYQLVEEYHKIGNFDFYLGMDGLSIYFVILITIITPIALLSNWSSIKENIKPFLIIMLLLETLLLTVFIVLDTLLFYIFFESILPPLFLLIGIFGSKNRVRAGFYLFLYTLLGSLFLLLSILNLSSELGTSDFDMIYRTNVLFYIQVFAFCGIFIAFAVKTPTIFLNTWLLKAHVESPLGGSIILAAIVLKLSLYGILRLILPLLHKAYMNYTPIIYVVGVVTILYASISTLRTIDIKELIAYSSVSHAAVYLIGIISSIIQGIQGGILLGLAHGFVSSGLFICTGGVLYDRSSTRLISFYRGFTQIMPLFVILFFILCLGNAGTPLSLNFVGEFLSLYGTFERMPLLGAMACSSIVFSAAYTFYMFNRIAFAGTLSKFFLFNLPDLSKREFNMLLVLVLFTVILGVYPAPILDGLQYSTSMLVYNLNGLMAFCDASNILNIDLISNSNDDIEYLVELNEKVFFYSLIITFAILWGIFSFFTYNSKTFYIYLCELIVYTINQPLNIITSMYFVIKLLFMTVCYIFISFICLDPELIDGEFIDISDFSHDTSDWYDTHITSFFSDKEYFDCTDEALLEPFGKYNLLSDRAQNDSQGDLPTGSNATTGSSANSQPSAGDSNTGSSNDKNNTSDQHQSHIDGIIKRTEANCTSASKLIIAAIDLAEDQTNNDASDSENEWEQTDAELKSKIDQAKREGNLDEANNEALKRAGSAAENSINKLRRYVDDRVIKRLDPELSMRSIDMQWKLGANIDEINDNIKK